MTNSERNTNHNLRKVGIGSLAALGLIGAFGIGGALNGGPKDISADNSSPTPSASEAAGTPEASKAPEVSAAPEVNIQNFAVEKLGSFEVLPGDIIAGDIAMSDTKDSAIFPLYDQDTHKAVDVKDNTKTALYVEVQAPGVVHAEWGATVTRGLTAEKKAEMLKLQAISKERAGFDEVKVVVWTGYETTVDQAGFKANNEQGSILPTSSASPDASPITGSNLEDISNQDKIKLILNLFATGKIDANSAEGKALLDVLANCFCSKTECTKPAETPKPTPEPTKSPEACIPSMKDHVMKPGETYKVPTGIDFIAQGDVLIDGKKTYDSNEKTGAVSVVTDSKGNIIKAPWGADIQVFECATDPFIKETYNNDVDQLKATGRSLDKNSINQLKN